MKKLIYTMVFSVLLSLVLIVTLAMAGDPDLILYLPMDEGSGDTVKDLSPNKLDGKIVGKDFKWVDAKKGKGLEFVNGTDIQISDNALLDGMKALTIEMWVKMDTHQDTMLVFKGPAAAWPGASYLLQPWSDQQIYFGVNDLASRAIAPPGSYSLKTWYHLAAVFTGQDLIVYIDGVEKSKAASPVKQVPDTVEPLEIARGATCTVDDFAMYARALTLAEVNKDMGGISTAVNSSGSLTTTWGSLKASH